MAKKSTSSTPFDITLQLEHEHTQTKGISIRIQALELLSTSTISSPSKPTINPPPTTKQPTQSHHEVLQHHPQPGRRCLRSRLARRNREACRSALRQQRTLDVTSKLPIDFSTDISQSVRRPRHHHRSPPTLPRRPLQRPRLGRRRRPRMLPLPQHITTTPPL